ncbi:uncharacterized protein B0J16DRAFT_316926 [Fusarium flagelliforme]|uniref:uncharacterized protein n=1 Tax=Fusarium flagelliforme TaxID=2675880 RepID=UPI001E8DCDAA|nr:uncharacterized protein B0J16DRAFT_316926 [Fusarium flagelliforme]KAH7193263.1 hypothetical protein B0J16DRAFT_316926 [Fusarium flagelliforme]
MTRDTYSPDIYTLFSQCITHIDTILRDINYQSASFKRDFPLEDDVRDIRQDFNQWGIRYGADRSVSSTLSLDYKFRKQDYTRSTIQSQLGHLAEDLEGLEKLCKGESYQGDAKVMFSRVESVVNELIRFLGYLPKELWLDQDK